MTQRRTAIELKVASQLMPGTSVRFVCRAVIRLTRVFLLLFALGFLVLLFLFGDLFLTLFELVVWFCQGWNLLRSSEC